jgi:hypothetical protein
MLTKLKSGEVIIQEGKIILNQAWIEKQERKEKQAEIQWQKKWSWFEWRLAELEKGEQSM